MIKLHSDTVDDLKGIAMLVVIGICACMSVWYIGKYVFELLQTL